MTVREADEPGTTIPGRPRQTRPRGTAGRVVVLIALAAFLAGGVYLERRDPDVAATRLASASDAAASVASTDAVSTAWYCAAGTAAPDGASDEVVYVANLSRVGIEAVVTVYSGAQDPPRTRRVAVAAYERARVRVADIVVTRTPGVVVEVLGGPAIVEHQLTAGNDFAIAPCADEPSRVWYFAAGSTVRGTAQALELFNPFGDDAIVDIAFVTDTGMQEPQALQGFVVGRRSKVVAPVQDLVPRQARVATVIRARTGRIIAEQSGMFDGTDGRSGFALALGAPRPRREWILPFGEAGPGVASRVSLANFGVGPAEVEVSILLPSEGVLAPETVDVPSRSVVAVDTGARVPAGSGYVVVVRAQTATPIVAEMSLGYGAGSATRGAATGIGAPGAVSHWALAGTLAGTDTVVLAVNHGARPVTVELRGHTAGDPNSPRSAPAIALGPGKVARFDLDDWGINADQVLEISADGPIVVGREVIGHGMSVAVAVPFRN